MENLKGRQKLGCAGLVLGLPLLKIPATTFGLGSLGDYGVSSKDVARRAEFCFKGDLKRNKISLYLF